MSLLQGTMTPIQTVTVGAGGAASIEFTSIPGTYTDLVVLASLRGTVSATNDDFLLKINNDGTTSRYTTRSLSGNGAAASSATSGYTGFAYLGVCDAVTATASTFSNHQIYIPNYAGSNQKSYSADTVQENNATTAFASLHAGLYNQTTAITSLVFLTASGNFAQYSTATLYGIRNHAESSILEGAKARGGVVTSDANYWYHSFTSSGTFAPTESLTCEVLVVAGGAGGGGATGGDAGAGGGGAGGLVYNSSKSVTATNYTVTIGAGGTSGGGSPGSIGGTGNNSVFDTMTANGGGGGGQSRNTTGGSGGSGGGGGSENGAKNGGSATQGNSGGGTGYGNAGGTTPGTGNSGGGGGGGAGAAGGSGVASVSAGNGGDGLNTWSSWASATSTGVLGYYAGGGGGGTYSTRTGGLGGAGGGGRGGNATGTVSPVAGATNTGSGGGGQGDGSSNAGAGGSGIVIIRYPK